VVSVLRTLQAEWNELVPLARARGVPRVRLLNAPLESIAYRREKLEWLRRQLGATSSMTTSEQIVRSAEVSSQVPEDLTYGVEIECFLPTGMSRDDMARHLSNAGIPCQSELYNHHLRTCWKILTDGSLGDYTRGCELVSPVMQGTAALDDVRKVCEVLTSHRVKVSRRCGFHVHVGARGQDAQFFKNLVSLYHHAQDTIDNFMSPSRRANANTFARPVRISSLGALARANTIDDVVRAVGQTPGSSSVRGGSRYAKLNLMSYYQHGTVEFRHHQGTVEFDKIANWIKFCLRMVEAARKGVSSVRPDLGDILRVLEAGDDEKAYFVRRTNFFARHDGRPAIRLEDVVQPTPAPVVATSTEQAIRQAAELEDRTRDFVSADYAAIENRMVMHEMADQVSRSVVGRRREAQAPEAAAATREAQMAFYRASAAAQDSRNPFERHGDEAEEAAHSRQLPRNWR